MEKYHDKKNVVYLDGIWVKDIFHKKCAFYNVI